MSAPTEDAGRCERCGQALAVGAAFCRHCGTRRAPQAPAPTAPATEAPQSQEQTETQVLPVPPAPPAGQPHAAPPAAPQSQSKRRGKQVVIAAIAGLLVGGGVAAAIVLLGGDDSKQASGPEPGSGITVPTGETPVSRSGEASSSGEAEATGFPAEDRAQMASEIQALLLGYHEDILSGDAREAWSLLSARKRRQAQREDGFAAWARNQATLSPYLTPAGLTVRIDELEGEGVARVLLSGMGWSAPGSPCTEWSGLTWVKYEGGEWTYDPGYSTTPERERAWKPRYDELLGASC